MTGIIAIYVPARLNMYGTIDSGDTYLVRVMSMLDILGVVRLGSFPITPKKGHGVHYTVTPWGRNLVWLKTQRGYWVRIPLEDY